MSTDPTRAVSVSPPAQPELADRHAGVILGRMRCPSRCEAQLCPVVNHQLEGTTSTSDRATEQWQAAQVAVQLDALEGVSLSEDRGGAAVGFRCLLATLPAGALLNELPRMLDVAFPGGLERWGGRG